jgi:hypothetical protein
MRVSAEIAAADISVSRAVCRAMYQVLVQTLSAFFCCVGLFLSRARVAALFDSK